MKTKNVFVTLFVSIALLGLARGAGFPALSDKPSYKCTPYLSQIVAGLKGLKMQAAIDARKT